MRVLPSRRLSSVYALIFCSSSSMSLMLSCHSVPLTTHGRRARRNLDLLVHERIGDTRRAAVIKPDEPVVAPAAPSDILADEQIVTVDRIGPGAVVEGERVERGHEFRAQRFVGVDRQYPVPGRKARGFVLRRPETQELALDHAHVRIAACNREPCRRWSRSHKAAPRGKRVQAVERRRKRALRIARNDDRMDVGERHGATARLRPLTACS